MIDLRRAATLGLQEGAYAAGSFEVTQRGAGANMSVDIAASTHENGIAAVIQGDSVTGQSLYPVPPHSAVINETITAAHATLPRVDAVILEIQDHVHDASGANLVRVRVITGTATSGTTLNNARDGSHGGAAIPSNAFHIADVLVGAAVSSITNSVIRDRRKWARGAYRRIVLTPGSNWVLNNGSLALVDGTNLAPRVECSGVPLRMTLTCAVLYNTASARGALVPQTDSVGWDGAPSVGATLPFTYGYGAVNNVVALTNIEDMKTFTWATVPAAGSHVLSVAGAANGAVAVSLYGQTTTPLVLTIEEILRQNTANNATTTG